MELSKLFTGADIGAHIAGAGFLVDTLKSAVAPYINQYLSDRDYARNKKETEKYFVLNYLKDKQAQDRSEALQREAWSRDDEQYQRTVKDMQKAGLNPILANGGASSSAVSFSSGSSVSPALHESPEFNPSDSLNSLLSLAQYKLSQDEFEEQKNVNAGNDESRKKSDKLAENADKRSGELHQEEMNQQKVQTDILKAQLKKAQTDAENAQYELTHKQKFGYADSSPEKIKLVKETAGNVVSGVNKILPKDNRTEIKTQSDSDLSQGQKNLEDFATWLSHVDTVAYNTYMSPYVSQGEKEQIVQRFRNRYMNASKDFKREKTKKRR